jgi:hypothetical protein
VHAATAHAPHLSKQGGGTCQQSNACASSIGFNCVGVGGVQPSSVPSVFVCDRVQEAFGVHGVARNWDALVLERALGTWLKEPLCW